MSFAVVKARLDSELEVNKLGDLRKFKFILSELHSLELTISFFILVLKYKKWQANKIAYDLEYKKRIYLLRKNSSQPQ